jgi:hypothetical protein
MIDKELFYEELPVVVTDVVAVLFPPDHGCHTRPSMPISLVSFSR